MVNDNEDLQQDIPNVFICPITLKLMEDPVLLSDGISYERTAIERWLSTNNRSPKTNQALSSKRVFANSALKVMIQEYVEKKHQEYLEANSQPRKRQRKNGRKAGKK